VSLSVEAAESSARILSELEKRGYEAAVLVGLKSSLMIKLAHGEASVTQSWKTLSASALVAREGRMAIYTSESPEPWRDIISSAESLKAVEPSPLYAPLPEPTGKPLSSVDSKIREAVETGEAGFVVEDLELEGIGDAAGMILLEHAGVALKTTAGADYSYEYTRFNGYIRVFVGEASGQWSWTSTRYDVEAAKRAIGQARELARECNRLPRASIEPGEYRILLSPMVVGNLMEEVAMSASAGMALFGMSFLRDAKPGDPVASEILT
jgi:predicted Zn-dependent protease